MTENITDNMNQAGHNGSWLSLIKDMKCYRILVADDLTMIAYNQDMTSVSPQEHEQIMEELKNAG